jgi:hypothetical protein
MKLAMYQMNLPKIRRMRRTCEPRAVLDRRAEMRIALDAAPGNEPNHELIGFAHRVARATTHRNDDAPLHG